LFSFAADLELYHAEQSLVETLTEELRAQSPAGVIWHQGVAPSISMRSAPACVAC
jgi:hypothetical protein